MTELRIEVPGAPVPKQSMRTTRKGGFYKTKRVRQQEELIRAVARDEMIRTGVPALEGAAVLHCQFVLPIPKSWSKEVQMNASQKAHVARPDLDNLVKLVKDALEGTIIVDDKIICEEHHTKVYEGPAQKPATLILIEGN